MKKFKIITLTLVFCIASLGVSGTFHYCAGKIKSISMNKDQHMGCKSCATGAAEDNSCCSEESTLFQYDDFQFQKASFNLQYLPSFIVTIPYFIPLDDSKGESLSTKGYNTFITFYSSSTDTQSRLCVFTI